MLVPCVDTQCTESYEIEPWYVCIYILVPTHSEGTSQLGTLSSAIAGSENRTFHFPLSHSAYLYALYLKKFNMGIFTVYKAKKFTKYVGGRTYRTRVNTPVCSTSTVTGWSVPSKEGHLELFLFEF